MHLQPTPQFRQLVPSSKHRLVPTNIAARITGLSCRMIRYLAQTCILPAVRNGKRSWAFRVCDLEDFCRNREKALEFGARVTYTRQNNGFPYELDSVGKIGGTLSVPGW
jgi:hypothetical protein